MTPGKGEGLIETNKLKILSLFKFETEEAQKEKFCCNLEQGSFEFEVWPESEEELQRSFSEANIVLAFPVSPHMDRSILESAKELQLAQFMSVGYGKIDLEAATDLGIPVANNMGFNAVAVAEHAIMMVLVRARPSPL